MQNLSHALQPQLAERIAAAGVPGLAVATVEGGAATATVCAGVMRRGRPQPVRSETIFQAASLSKPVFAYAVLRLVDAGVLELDRPLHAYLPPPEAAAEPGLERVTARQVLSHATGLQNWRRGTEHTLRLAFPPGTRFAYSGEG